MIFAPQLVHLPSQEVHPLVKGLFLKETFPNLKLAGRLSHFLMKENERN